jgi:hypothetical protein
MSRSLEPSLFHKLTGSPLGAASKALYSDDRCFDESAFGWITVIMEVGISLGIVLAIVHSAAWWLVLLASPIPIWMHVQQGRGEARERFARARIRRHECIRCGVKLDDESAHYCTDCGNAFAA